MFRIGATSLVVPLVADAPGVGDGDQPRWGVFDDAGTPVIEPDNVVSVEYLREFRISDYPIEGGGFESYNKVATPRDARLVMTKGGNDNDRQQFLADCEAACESTDTYTIVTPEVIYESVNLVRHDYRRSAQGGATLLTVELHFVEIRQTATVAFTRSKEPAGSDAVNDGAVQTQKPKPAQTPPAAKLPPPTPAVYDPLGFTNYTGPL